MKPPSAAKLPETHAAQEGVETPEDNSVSTQEDDLKEKGETTQASSSSDSDDSSEDELDILDLSGYEKKDLLPVFKGRFQKLHDTALPAKSSAPHDRSGLEKTRHSVLKGIGCLMAYQLAHGPLQLPPTSQTTPFQGQLKGRVIKFKKFLIDLVGLDRFNKDYETFVYLSWRSNMTSRIKKGVWDVSGGDREGVFKLHAKVLVELGFFEEDVLEQDVE